MIIIEDYSKPIRLTRINNLNSEPISCVCWMGITPKCSKCEAIE